MASPVEAYLRATDNADDYSQAQIVGLEQKALEDIDQLMTEADERDEELWAQFEADGGATVGDFEAVDEEDRGMDWVVGLSSVAAASGAQFFLDNRDKALINPIAYREQVMSGISLTREQLIQAGKRSTDFVADVTFRKLQAKYVEDLAFMRGLSNAELYEQLRAVEALRPPQQAIADASGYVSRMTRYKPGSTQFKEATADLVNVQSKRGLVQQNRRSVERLYSFRQVDGDLDREMVWIGERSTRNCPYCPPLFGMVATYREFIDEIGMPGADVCSGGDYCNCHLDAA